MKKQLGNATFDIHVGYEDMGSENVGECCWHLNVGSLRRIFARFPIVSSSGMMNDAIGDAIEYSGEEPETLKEGLELAESIDDFTDNKVVLIRDTDAGIILIRAMAEIGGEWYLEWYGENKTWFFHDWDHATHDTYVTAKGPAISRIDMDSERRAQVNGAREALKAGISIDDVCAAVASILQEFESRFKTPIGSIWSDIFQGMVVVSK